MKVNWVACAVCMLVSAVALGAKPSSEIEKPRSAMQDVTARDEESLAVVDAEATYSLTVTEEVTLEDGTVLAVGEPLYVGDVIVEGAAINDGTATIWLIGSDGFEHELPPGGILMPGCMKKCTATAGPSCLAVRCYATLEEGKQCCHCECVTSGMSSCSCEVENPA